MFVWQQWAYLAMAVFGIACTILLIGKERKPISPGMALWITTWSVIWTAIVFSIPVES